MSLNRFQFIGNLTRNVDLRYTPAGKPVANVDIAVNGSYKDGETGDNIETVNYFRITVWGNGAEAHAEYLTKGSQILVEGLIENNNYEKDGQKVYGTVFTADYVQYLHNPAKKSAEAEAPKSHSGG